MSISYLYISPVGGICNEMYNPYPRVFEHSNTVTIRNHRLDANNHFWSLILNEGNIKKLLNDINTEDRFIPWKKSAITNKKLFITRISYAKEHICDDALTPQEFFSILETLNQLCILYSEYKFYPIQLSLQDGFLLETMNSRFLWENALNPSKNPYLPYIKKYIMPTITNEKPNIVFLEGRPSFYTFAIAMLIRKMLPKCQIIHTRHSSEYYSLNKIDYMLSENNYYFRAIDAVILEFFEATEHEIIQELPLRDIPNLIYSDRKGKVVKNQYITKHKDSLSFDLQSPNSSTANVHLEPNHKCYWNKCTFCGINKKYHFNNDDGFTLDATLQALQNKIRINDVSKVWFIDEAISSNKLRIIAKYFIDNNIKISWQVRTRISPELIKNNLPALLANSGLKEIRLGLESASLNILRKMNKIDEDFSLDLVQEICRIYSFYKIAVHFPVIIGFPGETINNRRQTYDFLRKICSDNPYVSFNINVYQMDVASHVFQEWTTFNVSKVQLPCMPQYFLGNMAIWEPTEDVVSLRSEQNALMREILYPWMPKHCTLEPHIFYRLSETSRLTLKWRCMKSPKKPPITKTLTINPSVTITKDGNTQLYILYNWCNHHYMIGNDKAIILFKKYKSHINDTITSTNECDKEENALIDNWIKYQFLITTKEVIS